MSSLTDLQTGVGAALATTALFSFSAIAGNRLSRLVGGVEANFLRIILATLLLGAYAHTRGRGFAGAALPYFLLSGLIGFGIGDLALYQAFPRIGSRLSMILVHCLAAPVATFIEWLWLGTALTLFQVTCSLVVLLGVAVALAPKEHLHIPRRVLTAGLIFGVVAALGQAVGSVTSRKAYAVARLAHESIDGVSAAYQRIWGESSLPQFLTTFIDGEREHPSTKRHSPRECGWLGNGSCSTRPSDPFWA
ncbi:MAG TPA: DMT family transporter [Verrucomicrobiae bacterium]|nr:DMT family transporter [Verrucomicrobiae bacterium]